MENELKNCPKCNSFKRENQCHKDYVSFKCGTDVLSSDHEDMDQSLECIISCRDLEIKELESKISELENKYLNFASKDRRISDIIGVSQKMKNE